MGGDGQGLRGSSTSTARERRGGPSIAAAVPALIAALGAVRAVVVAALAAARLPVGVVLRRGAGTLRVLPRVLPAGWLPSARLERHRQERPNIFTYGTEYERL